MEPGKGSIMKKLTIALSALCMAVVLAAVLAGCAQPAASSQAAGGAGGASETAPAASSEAAQTAEPHIEGTYYGRYDIVDRDIGVPAFSVFLPNDWEATLYSDWTVVSADVPGMEEVAITSPDGLASITIDSCQSYTQGPTGAEGQDFGAYTTYMNYLDAGAFTDAYINSAYGGAATLVRELPDDSATLALLAQYLDALVAQANAAGERVTGGGAIGGITSVAEPAAYSMCRRQYQVGSQQIETSVVNVALTQTISGPALTEQYLHWRIPYSIVYTAASADAFAQYHDIYETIVANSYFTTEYYAAVEYISGCIAKAAMDAKAAASSGASGYSSSGYESATAESTNEKVIGMWDDYINEVDSYTTLDGGTVKTSMYNDVVAQSGDEFFVGSSTSDVPAGFTELSKSY